MRKRSARRAIALALGVALPLWTVSAFPALAAPSLSVASTPRSFSPNGDGQEDSLTATFHLDAAANVTAVVRNTAGDDVRSITTDQSHASGRVDLTWDGRTNAGAVAADGDYSIIVTATSSDGIPATSSLVTAIDTRVPGTLTAPTAGSTVSGLVDLVVSPTAGMDVSSVYWSLPGCGWSSSTPAADGTFQVAQADMSGCAAGEQTLSWQLSWFDQFRQSHSYSGSAAVTVTDASAPVVALMPGYENPVVALSTPGQTAPISAAFRCVDGSAVSWAWRLRNPDGAVVRSYDRGDPNTSQREICQNYFDANLSVDGLDEVGDLLPSGAYTLVTSVTDAGGQTGTLETPLLIDTRVPGTLTAPTAGSTVSGLVDLVVSPTAGMDVSSVYWSLPGCGWSSSTPAADGTFQVAQADMSGCAAGEQTLSWQLSWFDQFRQSHSYSGSAAVTVTDASAPVVALMPGYENPVVALSTPGQTAPISAAFRCVDGSAVSWAWRLRNPDGAVVRSYDRGDPNTSQREICQNYFDANLSVDGLDEVGDLLPSGAYTLVTSVTDAGGQTGTLETPLLIDTRVPGTLTAPTAGSTVSGLVDLVVSPTAGMDVSSVYWSLPGCGWSSSTPAADGTFQVAQADMSGCAAGEQTLSWQLSWFDQFRQSHSYSGSAAVTVTDASAPVVALMPGYENPVVALSTPGQTAPISAAFRCVDGSAVSWAWRLRNPDGAVVRSYDRGDPNTSQREICQNYFDANLSVDGLDEVGDLLPSGAYTLVTSVTDAGGQTGTLETPLLIDTRVPGTLTTPTAGSTLAGRPTFEFTPTASFPGISEVNVTLAAQPTASFGIYNASADGVWRTTYPMGGLTRGSAELGWTVSWRDQFGQQHAYAPKPIEVAIDPVSMPLEASLDPATGTAPLTTTLNVKASDPNGRALSLQVNWGDDANQQQTINDPYDPVSLQHEFTEPGTYNVFVSASNGAGGYASQTIPLTVGGKPNAAPILEFDVTPTTGSVPFDVTANMNADDPEGDSLTYKVDFGDGTTPVTGQFPPDATLTHRFTKAGLYLVRATVTDGRLIAVRTSSVQAFLSESLVANAGDDQSAVAGDVVHFNGSASKPAEGIGKYHWAFGDGQEADGMTVDHAYASAGEFIATLTVTAGTETKKDTTAVTVISSPPTPGLAVRVEGAAGAAIPGADVVVIDAAGTRTSAVTRDDGTARLQGLADGKFSVYGWAEGYRPGQATATVTDNSGAATIRLTAGQVATASITSTPLTRDEIIAAGIDPDSPANQNVVQFTASLAIDAGTFQASGYAGNDRFSLCPEVSGVSVSCENGAASFVTGGLRVTATVSRARGQAQIIWLVVPAKASWLKEFFNVQLMVSNLAEPGFVLDQGSAKLNLPIGLSLAPTAVAQSLIQPVPDIDGGKSATASWLVRGDKEGEYPLTGSYAGMLEPFGAPISIDAVSDKPLHVWGERQQRSSSSTQTRMATRARPSLCVSA